MRLHYLYSPSRGFFNGWRVADNGVISPIWTDLSAHTEDECGRMWVTNDANAMGTVLSVLVALGYTNVTNKIIFPDAKGG